MRGRGTNRKLVPLGMADNDSQPETFTANPIGMGLAIGIAIGIGLSLATGNWAMLAVGIAVGAAVATAQSRRDSSA